MLSLSKVIRSLLLLCQGYRTGDIPSRRKLGSPHGSVKVGDFPALVVGKTTTEL
jgi:hypothetical protein